MTLDLEGENRNFETNFRTEYGPKKIRKLFKATPFAPEYISPNPITESYNEHINTKKGNDRLPIYKRTESAADYLNKVRNERPHLKKVLSQDPPDEAVVERNKRRLLRSTYQLEIAMTSDDRDSYNDKKAAEISLPKNYSIPETMQKKFFRDPRHYSSSNSLNSSAFKKPPGNLTINEKEREILRVRTGDTEYQSEIGKVGRGIIEQSYDRSSLTEGVLGNSDNQRSICSNILGNTSKNPISQIY